MTTQATKGGDNQERDTVLRRMLKTPPKPHEEMKVGKSKSGRRKQKEPVKDGRENP